MPKNQPNVQRNTTNNNRGMQNAARALIQGIFDWQHMDIDPGANKPMKGWQIEHTYGLEYKTPIDMGLYNESSTSSEPFGGFVEYTANGSTKIDYTASGQVDHIDPKKE